MRRFVRVQAEQEGHEPQGEDAALVAGELLQGSRGPLVPVSVRTAGAAGGLLVSVEFEGPPPLEFSEFSEALLSALGESWGWEASASGVRAWCRVA